MQRSKKRISPRRCFPVRTGLASILTDQRIISKPEAKTLLDHGNHADKLSGPEFDGKIRAAMDRAEQLYGPKYAQRAFAEAAHYLFNNEDKRQQAINLVGQLAFGQDPTREDFGLLQAAKQLDPMSNYVELIRGRPDQSLALPAASAGVNDMVPNKGQIALLKSNPDQWQAFDRKFGAGASAYYLQQLPGKYAPTVQSPGFLQKLFGPSAETQQNNAKFAGTQQTVPNATQLPGSVGINASQ